MIKKVFFDIEDYYVLPKKYHLIHEYCFYLHDQLVKIVKDGEEKKYLIKKLKRKKCQK